MYAVESGIEADKSILIVFIFKKFKIINTIGCKQHETKQMEQ